MVQWKGGGGMVPHSVYGPDISGNKNLSELEHRNQDYALDEIVSVKNVVS